MGNRVKSPEELLLCFPSGIQYFVYFSHPGVLSNSRSSVYILSRDPSITKPFSAGHLEKAGKTGDRARRESIPSFPNSAHKTGQDKSFSPAMHRPP